MTKDVLCNHGYHKQVNFYEGEVCRKLQRYPEAIEAYSRGACVRVCVCARARVHVRVCVFVRAQLFPTIPYSFLAILALSWAIPHCDHGTCSAGAAAAHAASAHGPWRLLRVQRAGDGRPAVVVRLRRHASVSLSLR